MKKVSIIFLTIFLLFCSIYIFIQPVKADDEWLDKYLEQYIEKLNDKYLLQRMDQNQIEKNTNALLRDYLTPDDLSLLANPRLAELLAFPTLYDEKEVLFYGQAIGQPMKRNLHSWVNVMDEDGNSIGCWMPNRFVEEITFFGRYGYDGDMLLVKGIYHVADEKHGGETLIEANDLIVLNAGKKVQPEEINFHFVYIIFIFAIGIVILLIIQKRKNGKKNMTSGGGIFFGSED